MQLDGSHKTVLKMVVALFLLGFSDFPSGARPGSEQKQLWIHHHVWPEMTYLSCEPQTTVCSDQGHSNNLSETPNTY